MEPDMECVAGILEKHMDQVDWSEGYLKARKYDRVGSMYQRVWIMVEICYNGSKGLEVGRVLESKFENPDGIPHYETFEDKTEKYRDDSYVRRLVKSIAGDIRNECLYGQLRPSLRG